MTSFDFVVIGIIGLSILLGLMRGGVKEILSLAAWVMSFLMAKTFADVAAGWLPAMITNPALRYLGGFIVIFVLVMAVAMLLSLLLAESLKAAGLGGLDRVLGLTFGAIRGMVIVLILVLLAGLTVLPKTEVWKNALLAPTLVKLAIMAEPWLPDSLVQHIHF